MSKVLYRIVSFITAWHRRVPSPRLTVCFLGAFFLAIRMPACGQDTIRVLDEVDISSQQPPPTLRTVAPTQVLDAVDIENQGALQLSDAVRQMAGVTLKDYGGVGGMKTVSARGLGSQFSTVTIDGVAVNDAQNGQVDLGRYLLGNAAYVSLSHGREQGSLLSARAMAAGNVLNLETAEPSFFLAERTNLKVGMEMGSFGMLSPTALWEQKWGRRLKTSLWANYLKSDGDYPFTLYYTPDHQGHTSRERRLHSAMHMLTADANLFYTIDSANRLTGKVHYMRGHHQLPGPVQLYTQTVSAEQTAEEVAFAQLKWNAERGRWRLQSVGKLQSLYDLWEDSAANTPTGYQFNAYRQREAYLSVSASRPLGGGWDVDLAADGALSHLLNNKAHCNDVHRSMLMGAAALRYALGPLKAELHAVATMVADRMPDMVSAPSYGRLTPYAGVAYSPSERTTLRLFYKETYRVPNFGELYFFPEDTLPHSLRPERARQLNLGLTHMSDGPFAAWNGTVDAYYNRVDDKIIAVPGRSMFLWTMINEGKVDILGVDATAQLQISSLSMQVSYGFAHAVVRTDPDNPATYGAQIPYTPRHSGGASLRWELPWVNLGASAMVVGHRYSDNQNSPASRLPAYCDLGLSADRRIDLRWGEMRVQVQVLNLLDMQYEVVRSYPMMGRNYRLSIMYVF